VIGAALTSRAVFTIHNAVGGGQNLQLDLKNLTTGTSANRADLLTARLFNFSAGVTVDTRSSRSS
jgi:hypothetical protein